MNVATLYHIPRSAYSLGTNRLHGLRSRNNRVGFWQTQIYLSARRLSNDPFVAAAVAEASSAYRNIYILRFGSQIHKHSKDVGIGIVIHDAADGKKLWTARRFIPVASAPEKITNNIADYMALADGLKALDVLRSNQILASPCRVEVQTSNRVVAKQLTKEFKVGTKRLQPWYETVTKLIESFEDLSAGQIPTTDCGDVKKASELAIKVL
jgi:ribonuclease HI